MAETFPSDANLNNLSGTADGEQAVPYIPVGLSPYHTEFYRMLYRLLDVSRRAGDLRAYKDNSGALKFGVRAGRFLNGDTAVTYAGASAQDLTDNQTNYIYLTADGTLVVNTTGFPTPSATPHLPLATIATGTQSAAGVSGQYDFADITDYRGRAFLTVAAGLTGATMAEAAAFFAATDITGAQAETLTDGSSADALHAHPGKADAAHTHLLAAGATDVSSTPEELNKLDGASANVTPPNLNTLTAGVASDADALHTHGGKANTSHTHGRSDLTTEALKNCPLRLLDFKNPSGVGLGTAQSAGWWNIMTTGLYGYTDCRIQSYKAKGGTNNPACVVLAEIPLPPEYVADGSVQVVVTARYAGTGTPGTTKTIDLTAYEVDPNGAFGSDLCTTAVQTVTGTWADYTFTITDAGLAPGDKLILFVFGVMSETGGANDLWLEIGGITAKMDVRG